MKVSDISYFPKIISQIFQMQEQQHRSLYFMSDFWAGCTFISPCNSLHIGTLHCNVLCCTVFAKFFAPFSQFFLHTTIWHSTMRPLHYITLDCSVWASAVGKVVVGFIPRPVVKHPASYTGTHEDTGNAFHTERNYTFCAGPQLQVDFIQQCEVGLQ